MKKLLVILLLLCSVSVFAQDVIVKKDGSTVLCRVEKVSETDVTYKLWSDLKGSSYVMDKSLVAAINYEKGKKETFGEIESTYLPNNQNDGEQTMNDAALLQLDQELNSESYRIYAENEYKKACKKVKRLKTWGWIGGVALVAASIPCFTLASTHSYGPGYNYYTTDDIGIICGVSCIVAGVGLTTTCLVVANKQKKKIDAAFQTSSIYRYDIPFSNGSSLSVGADLLNDRIRNKQTVGLGLTYNF